ncbi:MAG: alpha/beta hydrolase, partial [Betaproteobacteria bacterium]
GALKDNFGKAVIEFPSRWVPGGGEPVQPAHRQHPNHEGPEGDIVDVP